MFNTNPDEFIPTSCWNAFSCIGAHTAVIITAVSVVALFHAGVDETITTHVGNARVEAAICIFVVSVITRFTILDNPIAADRDRARVAAFVVVDVVVIIALFNARLNVPISARRQGTTGNTAVGVVDVSIITIFYVDVVEPIATNIGFA